METFNLCRNESPQASVEPKNDINLWKVDDVSKILKPKSQTISQTFLRMEKSFETEPNGEWTKTIVSYINNENETLTYLQKSQKFDSPEEILAGICSENNLESCDSKNYYRISRSHSSDKENSQDLQWKNSNVTICNDEEINAERMIEIIEKELRTLTDMSPSVIKLATALFETLSHYKECFRCSKKISSSLPRILNRIQELVEYVTAKRLHHKPDNCDYLKPGSSESTLKEPEGIKNSVSSKLKFDSHSDELVKQIQLSEKVNATDLAEGRPGIQIALEFKPEIKKKRVYEQADQIFLNNCYPIVQLRESNSDFIIQAIKPSSEPQVLLNNRQIILSAKVLFYAYHQIYLVPSATQLSFLVIIPFIRINRTEKNKRTPYFRSTKSSEGEILQTKKNPFTVFTPQGKKKNEQKTVRGSCSQTQPPNEKISSADRLAHDPEIVKVLLKEIGEEKMQIHKMKELELEAKELKDLILEVRKNQTELGKVVIEKGIYSQLVVSLTDPNILDEENQIVKKLAEAEKNSVENIQTTIDYVKQKCTLKNRMIMTLVKGLRSNLYKKWWEEVINLSLDESKSTEKFNHEEMTGLLPETSLILIEDRKDTEELLEEIRKEEQNSEEEPNVKELAGENFPMILSYGNQKLMKTKDYNQLSNLDDFLNCPSQMNILSFPITNVPDNMSSLIRKLEIQISVLCLENERLWHEIHELKQLLKDSMKRLSERRSSSADSGQKLSDRIKSSGKVINLTIQIASEKDLWNLNDSPRPKIIGNIETSPDNDFREPPRNPQTVKNSVTESVAKESLSDLLEEFKLRSKMAERRVENNLNDLAPTLFYDNSQENFKTLFREKNIFKEQKKPATSVVYPSSQDFRQNLKPILRVPSNHVIPEICTHVHQAGPSHKPGDIRYLLHSPSRTELIENQNVGMFATMANERELQTIPEHDHTGASSTSASLPKDINQAIQYLRTKVRSIHKDVAVLKSKNDRIDKMLDRLLDDAIDNNKNLDEVGNDLNHFKNRLG